MRKREIRAQRRAANERDHSWQRERDDDESRENSPVEEHYSAEEFADLAKSCLS